MKHVVIHQDWHGRSGSFHECYRVWTLKGGTQNLIVSLIITGSEPAVYYGTDDPEIRHRVDRLKKQRIDRGEHFASGPLFSGVPRIGPRAERVRTEDLIIVGRLHSALASEPRDVVLPEETSATGESVRQYQSVPGSKARWSDYLAAHHEKSSHARQKRLDDLLDEIMTFCWPCSPGVQRKRREQFRVILNRRRRTRGQGERAYYASPESLAMAMGAETLNVSVRNIKRRLHFGPQPGDFSYG